MGVFGGDAPIHELKPLVEGVVYKIRSGTVEVVFSDHGTDPNEALFGHANSTANSAGPFHLALLSSDVTMTRYKHALSDLDKAIQETGSHRVVDLCFGALPKGGSSFGAVVQPGPPPAPREKTFGFSSSSSSSSSPLRPPPDSSTNNTIVDVHFRPDFHDEFRFDTTFRSLVTKRLNEPQKIAVRRALLSKDLHIIHGPPGTGKTTTCVAFILECILRDNRLLVCAPSNVAVDNLLERVAKEVKGAGTKLVRIGHPTRVDVNLHQHTLDARVASSDSAVLCRDIESELKELGGQLRRAQGAKPGQKAFLDGKMRYSLRGETQRLRKELKTRSTAAVNEILQNTQVVFSTCAGAGEVRKRFAKMNNIRAAEAGGLFDVALVDEAAQTLEVACWIPLLCGRRAVLAGDHHQLAATVKSREAMNRGLDKTLFGRMQNVFGDEIASLLSIQYRMNAVIMGWSSDRFYEGRLEAAESVRDWLVLEPGGAGAEVLRLEDIDGEVDGEVGEELVSGSGRRTRDRRAAEFLVPSFPLVFADTVGNNRCREAASDGASLSRYNPGEVELVIAYIRYLTRSCGISLKTTTVCVISPYNQQVDALRTALTENGWLEDVPVNTVDSFQGREADVVILSLVRSNENSEVGFLADYRRLNVAVTRAKKHCVVYAVTK